MLERYRASTDLFAYVAMAEAFAARDEYGTAELEKDGRLVRLPRNTLARVITTGTWPKLPRYAELRVQEGKYQGKTVYASQGNLR